jgi:hypothetical protein
MPETQEMAFVARRIRARRRAFAPVVGSPRLDGRKARTVAFSWISVQRVEYGAPVRGCPKRRRRHLRRKVCAAACFRELSAMTLDEVAIVAASNPETVLTQVANIEIHRRAAAPNLGRRLAKCVPHVCQKTTASETFGIARAVPICAIALTAYLEIRAGIVRPLNVNPEAVDRPLCDRAQRGGCGLISLAPISSSRRQITLYVPSFAAPSPERSSTNSSGTSNPFVSIRTPPQEISVTTQYCGDLPFPSSIFARRARV